MCNILYNPPNVLLNFEFFKTNYFEILDLFLVSSSLIDKITDFCVLNSQDMTSDHFPIEASISMGYQLENKLEAKKFNYKKAHWQLFSEILNSQIVNITAISKSCEKCGSKMTKRRYWACPNKCDVNNFNQKPLNNIKPKVGNCIMAELKTVKNQNQKEILSLRN
ncbi:hypothetical protein BpHYR1_051007 [Brachionus plicatilis]|uniref:RNA-directed DNA polymerase from mobile element jockey-like n=1 Tax=Brachionus plicatilis TaxID=10195 RepID=A0A3M7SPX1_BRAPC|nr:hypothetical protein BpHYR1_051007 [Brachionus plicatilis]